MPLRRPAAGLTLFIAATALSPVRAQEVSHPINNQQLNFSNPGARSLGLGRPFAALADDATAAGTNPVGPVQITRPGVAIEDR